MNERLRQIRKHYNLSMREFASRLGMSSGAISMLENGQRNMSNQFINSVCAVFSEISEQWFRTGEGDMLKPLDREQEVAKLAKRILKADYDDVYANLVRNLAQLNESDLETLDKVVSSLVKGKKDSPQ